MKIRESRENLRSEWLREVKKRAPWDPATRVADEDGRSRVGRAMESARADFRLPSTSFVILNAVKDRTAQSSSREILRFAQDDDGSFPAEKKRPLKRAGVKPDGAKLYI